jgi:hypothetical protein
MAILLAILALTACAAPSVEPPATPQDTARDVTFSVNTSLARFIARPVAAEFAGESRIGELLILNAETLETVNDFDLTTLTMSGEPIAFAELSGFVVQDINFDGYRDIQFDDDMDDDGKVHTIRLLWNVSESRFEPNEQIPALGHVVFNDFDQTISVGLRISEAEYRQSTYRYFYETLREAERTVTVQLGTADVSALPQSITAQFPELYGGEIFIERRTLSQLNTDTLELEIAEDAYVLSGHDEAAFGTNEIARFDVNSESGALIAAIVEG